MTGVSAATRFVARLAAVVACGLVALAAVSEARTRSGVVTQAPLTSRDFNRMDRGDVETLRFLIRWRVVEPVKGSYEWSSIDSIVAKAAPAKVELLPFVYGSPEWIAESERHPPLDSSSHERAWKRFLGALVERYGRGGEFWSGAGRNQPIVRWQIWNEPNFALYWDPRPNPAEYARLLDISAKAIRSRDRRAKVVMAGVAPIAGDIPWWTYLRRLYRNPGVGRDFDLAALHPYSPGIGDLRIQVHLARQIMAANGDRAKPLAITEIGWSSGSKRAPLVVGARQQASLLRRSFRLLTRVRRWQISDVQWYAWQDALTVEPLCGFCKRAGLFDLRGTPKLAWFAYRALARGP